MNEFNNLKSVSVASPKRLMQIDGVNEQVATYLSLMRDILARIELRKIKASMSSLMSTAQLSMQKYALVSRCGTGCVDNS